MASIIGRLAKMHFLTTLLVIERGCYRCIIEAMRWAISVHIERYSMQNYRSQTNQWTGRFFNKYVYIDRDYSCAKKVHGNSLKSTTNYRQITCLYSIHHTFN